ncbi:MAG: transporter [Bacteroidales bacterium]|nr:transporter [Bacteroidales bacterium]
MKKLKKIFRDWKLPISMTLGAIIYFVFRSLPLPADVRQCAFVAVSRWIQPILLFMMLFLSFIKVKPTELRPHRWHLRVLGEQALWFVAFSLLAMLASNEGVKVLCEGAMLAFICPTATASAVITSKLGGSTSGVVTYLLLCNLMVSLLAPVFLTLVEPHAELSFLTSLFMIMGKVFPLLLSPLIIAWVVRYLLPGFHRWLLKFPDLAFNIWFVSLALAITVTVRSIMHSNVSYWYLIGLAIVSCVCCLMQFWRGRTIGGKYGHEAAVTAGQAFGQKNTVFIIWLGLVFLNPVTSVVGGFYSVWHNTVNSWQLYKVLKKDS